MRSAGRQCQLTAFNDIIGICPDTLTNIFARNNIFGPIFQSDPCLRCCQLLELLKCGREINVYTVISNADRLEQLYFTALSLFPRILHRVGILGSSSVRA